MAISDMNRLPASGSVTVTGPASRSKTPLEYNVSRFARITVWLSIDISSRKWWNLPSPPAFIELPKYRCDSALVKLASVTEIGAARDSDVPGTGAC